MKDINFSLKTLPKHLKHLAFKARRYVVVIFTVTTVALYGFLIFQISQASQAEPSPDAVAQQLTAVKRLKVDQQAIDKIQQLQDQSVNVQSLFQTARDNPFQE
jgi:hypothetical protein